jgi:O-antigen/teichoic acid export membrane protein
LVTSEVIVLKFRLLRSGLFGALADQAIVSAANFGFNILLARSFSEHNYGAFTLILSFILFLNSLHQAFVAFPLSVESASATRPRLDYFLGRAAILTLLEAILFVPVIGGAVLGAGQALLFAPVLCFMFSWQLQEVWRRGLIARAHYGRAVVSDFIRYILPLIIVSALGWFGHLSLSPIFLLLTVTSLIGAWPLLPLLLAQYNAVRRDLSVTLTEHWRLAAPVVAANLLGTLSTQWFLWLLAWGHDLSSSATLVALANVVGFASPVMFGLENMLVPEIARRRDSLTMSGLMKLIVMRTLAGGALVAPFFFIVMFWPAPILQLFYGAHKSYMQYTLSLQLLAAAYITYLIAYVLSATLRGYRASGAVLKMQLYPALMAVTLGSWLTLHFGVPGACFAALVAGSMRVAIGCYHVGRLRYLTVPEANDQQRDRLPAVPQSVRG